MNTKRQKYQQLRRASIGSGSVLTVLGVGGYLASGGASSTALLPAALGAPMIGWGVTTYVPLARMMVRPSLVSLSLSAIAAGAGGLKELPALFSGKAERPMAVVGRSATFLVGATLLIKTVRA